MAGKREILERTRKYEEQLDLHRITSSIYFLAANTHDELGLSIDSVSTGTDGIGEIIASRSIGENSTYSIKIFIVPELTDVPADVISDEIGKCVKAAISDGIRDIVLAGRKDLGKIREKLPEKERENVICWTLSVTGKLARSAGMHTDPDLESYFRENGEINLTDVFPIPYSKELHPLIKFAFLSLNYSRNGKFNMNSVIDYTSEFAYRTSVSVTREEIKDDFYALVRTLERIGLLTVKGNSVYFPKNRERFEKSFHRKYWDFLERSQKVTLFDFERHF